ncbi:sodium:solute symporter family protein [Adhaeribacter pallidiroseus]|uniref:Sodium/pantothenate symporter n=1 Tax=Adhaeribacter pallidiroseus TaxID=2072847 RepID=A0A369QMS7_9BACT|nr:sodium:solute symporter family protein [Adhaeribacter pallidiroseus]RDC65650.1 Sodium/pantothenate symporter [Adhaeribacter pallidiroseus]
MLLLFIGLYLLINVFIGVWAARRVQNTSDFLLAGRQLPFYISTAVVFATWFGSETVLGASSEFAENGLLGVIEDPFGAALCLVLVGLFFAKKLYRLNLLTFGDFYRLYFNRTTELVASFFLVISYFGWVAAQMVALGIILNLISGLSITLGIILGSVAVIIYTYMGGMWSVSITDFLQTIMIIGGLIFVTINIVDKVPVQDVLRTVPPHFFDFIPPQNSFTTWLNYLALWLTIGLGSIPQQDVFQRVMSAKSEQTAVYSSLAAAGLYLTIALLPLILVLYAKVLQPTLLQGDTQLLLPGLILHSTSLWVKILFFGALISAIISTASGAILAPAAILSENIFKPYFTKITDKQLLLLSRVCVLLVSGVGLIMALLKSNIYELVSSSSALSLVSLFVPLVAGLYTKRVSSLAAIISMVAGMVVWLGALWLDTTINPLLYGLLASIVGWVLGIFWPVSTAHPAPIKFSSE